MTRSAAPELLAPAWHWMPGYERTLGPEVADLAALAGFTPDPEQRLGLDMLFALGPSGRSAVRDLGLCAPRQNLKTGFLKQAALGWLYITEQRLVVWSAHEFGTAEESFRDMCVLIESCPDLDREVKQIHRGNGDEQIELTRDRRLKFKARTKVGGRGLSGDKVVLDEAMYLQPQHLGALMPTLRARPDPQVVLAGSAGLTESAVWRSYRDAGRDGGDPTLGWLEYADRRPYECASDVCAHVFGVEGCGLDDRARWWATNSALGRRISEEDLASDRRRLPWDEFARETVGWWDEPPENLAGAFNIDTWHGLADPSAERGQATFGIAVAPDRSWTAIGVAWRRPDGLAQVMLADYRPGAAWASARLEELQSRWGGKAFSDTAARGLVAGAEELSMQQQAQAHNALADAVDAAAVRHGNEAALNVSVRAARWRPMGDSRVLDRKGQVDVSPLICVALALYGLSTTRDRPGRFVSF